jgi:hypothetical protein
MRTRHSPSAGPVGARLLPYPGLLPAPALIGTPEAARHAMNSGVVTDIGKEASIARSGSTDDETKPTFGAQFAPHGRRSPIRAAPCCSQARPGVGPPPPWDLRVAFVSRSDERAIDLRGIWHAGGFHGNGRRVRPAQWRDASMDSSHPESGSWDTHATQCDCNLHSSRAQFVKDANRVFDQQIDAS